MFLSVCLRQVWEFVITPASFVILLFIPALLAKLSATHTGVSNGLSVKNKLTRESGRKLFVRNVPGTGLNKLSKATQYLLQLDTTRRRYSNWVPPD